MILNFCGMMCNASIKLLCAKKIKLLKMMIDEIEELYVAINSNLCTDQCISPNISSTIISNNEVI